MEDTSPSSVLVFVKDVSAFSLLIKAIHNFQPTFENGRFTNSVGGDFKGGKVFLLPNRFRLGDRSDRFYGEQTRR